MRRLRYNKGNWPERWLRRWVNELIVWPVTEIFYKHLKKVERKLVNMGHELEVLTAQVAVNSTVIDSAVILIQGIKAKLDAAGTNAAKLKALSDELGSSNQELADAVAANTPADNGGE